MNEENNNLSFNENSLNDTPSEEVNPSLTQEGQERNTISLPEEQNVEAQSQNSDNVENQQEISNEEQQPIDNRQPSFQEDVQPISQTNEQTELVTQEANVTQVQENSIQSEISQDIVVEQQPVNTIQPDNNVFGPSVPLVGTDDVTNVRFTETNFGTPKKKKTGLIATLVIVLIIILGLVGYFVIYPMVKSKYLDKPKNVYETTIKSLFNGISTASNEILHTKAIYDVDLSLDSNMAGLKDFTGYNFQINFGVDPVNKRLQEGINIKNNNVENSYYYYIKNNKIYEKISTYKDNAYIYLGESTDEVNSIFDKLNNEDIFNVSNKLKSEDLNYLIENLSRALINSIDTSKLSKEDTSININKETLKVTNNKYVINTDTYVSMVNSIIDEFINDDKALEILAKYNDASKDELKKDLEKEKITDSKDLDVNITTNIYTYGKTNDIVGIAINDDKDNLNFHYYFKDEYFEVNLVTKTDNEITGKKDTNNIELVGIKEGIITNVTLTYNSKKMLTLKIREWSDSFIDFDYEIAIENNVLTGSFKLNRDVNDSRAKYNIDFTLKAGDEYLTVKANINIDWTSEVANINTDAAVTLDDNELTMQKNAFIKAIQNTPIGKLFSTVSGDYDDNIPDYYDDLENISTPEPEVS